MDRLELVKLRLEETPQDSERGSYVIMYDVPWLIAEIERLRNLREFDTGAKKLSVGVMLEHARLDSMWQKLVAERDEAKREVEREKTFGEKEVALRAKVDRLIKHLRKIANSNFMRDGLATEDLRQIAQLAIEGH